MAGSDQSITAEVIEGLGYFSLGEVQGEGELAGQSWASYEEGEENVKFDFWRPSRVHVFPGSSAEKEIDVVFLRIPLVAELFQDSSKMSSAKGSITTEHFLKAPFPSNGLPECFSLIFRSEFDIVFDEG